MGDSRALHGDGLVDDDVAMGVEGERSVGTPIDAVVDKDVAVGPAVTELRSRPERD